LWSNFEGQMACSGGFMTRLNKSQLQVEICVPSGLVGVGICSSLSFVALDTVGHCRPTAIRIITSDEFVQFVNGILSIVHFSVYNCFFLSLCIFMWLVVYYSVMSLVSFKFNFSEFQHKRNNNNNAKFSFLLCICNNNSMVGTINK
jgi:hypothetical protein